MRAIERINGLKGGGFELSLQRGQESSEIVALEQAEVAGDATPPLLNPAELSLAKEFPGAAIDKFYKEVEARILEIRSEIPDQKRHRNLNEVMKWLRDHGHISQSVGRLWLAIREARNQVLQASRDEGISGYDAVAFGTQAKQLLEALKGIEFA